MHGSCRKGKEYFILIVVVVASSFIISSYKMSQVVNTRCGLQKSNRSAPGEFLKINRTFGNRNLRRVHQLREGYPHEQWQNDQSLCRRRKHNGKNGRQKYKHSVLRLFPAQGHDQPQRSRTSSKPAFTNEERLRLFSLLDLASHASRCHRQARCYPWAYS